MARIFGMLLSGAAVRIMGGALAVYIGIEAAGVFADSMAAASAALDLAGGR